MLAVVISVGVLLGALVPQDPPTNMPVLPIILSPEEAEWYRAVREMAFLAGACERFFPDFERRLEDNLPALAQYGTREASIVAGARNSFQRGRTDPGRHERTLESCQAEIAQAVADWQAMMARP